MYNHSDERKIQLLGDDFEGELRDKDNQNAVALALIISFEQIKKSDPHAADILSFMSMLDPQAIPRSLLPGDENPEIFQKALATLQAFSLINKSSRQAQGDEFYDLHRLVRLVMRGYLRNNNDLDRSMQNATLIMLDRFPHPALAGNREICRTLHPHAVAILSSLKTLNGFVSSQAMQLSHRTQFEMKSDFLYNMAIYIYHKGKYQAAQLMTERSLSIRERVLGLMHEKSLECANLLMIMISDSGQNKEAVQLGRMTLRRAERALGQDHRCSLQIMCNLGLSFKPARKTRRG